MTVINLGTAPDGSDGDTKRAAFVKVKALIDSLDGATGFVKVTAGVGSAVATIPATSIAAGTAGIDISGNAATATSAASATTTATAIIYHGDGTKTLYQASSNTAANNGAAIQAAFTALAANESIELGPCAANISSTLVIPSGVSVVLNGTRLASSVSNLTMFSVASATWSLTGRGGASLTGQEAGTEIGLSITPPTSGNCWRVAGLTFINWNGKAIGFTSGGAITDHMNGSVSACTFLANGGTAISIPSPVEYMRFYDTQIYQGATGIACAAGNNQFVNGSIIGTVTIGFDLQVGTNDSHGFVANYQINHNAGIAVRLGAVTNGYQFVNCDFFSNGTGTNTISIGAVASNIQFIGGILASEITFTGTPTALISFLNMKTTAAAGFLTYVDAQRAMLRFWACVSSAGLLSGYPLGNDPTPPALGLRNPRGVTAPAIAAGTGAGTSPTISVLAGSTDYAGQISVLTGSAPSASAVVATLTFATAFSGAPTVIPTVLLLPANAAAAALSGTGAVYISSPGTTSFALSVGSTQLGATTTYLWNYLVIG